MGCLTVRATDRSGLRIRRKEGKERGKPRMNVSQCLETAGKLKRRALRER